MSLILSMSMPKYLFSFGVETDYVHFDLNGDPDLNFHSSKINIKRSSPQTLFSPKIT